MNVTGGLVYHEHHPLHINISSSETPLLASLPPCLTPILPVPPSLPNSQPPCPSPCLTPTGGYK